MDLSQRKSRLLTPRVLLLGFSLISLVICAWAAAAHYRKLAWGVPWQSIGWLLRRLFLLFAFTKPTEADYRVTFLFARRLRMFYTLKIGNKNIRQFKEWVTALPGTPL
jgi:hypothetical protein